MWRNNKARCNVSGFVTTRNYFHTEISRNEERVQLLKPRKTLCGQGHWAGAVASDKGQSRPTVTLQGIGAQRDGEWIFRFTLSLVSGLLLELPIGLANWKPKVKEPWIAHTGQPPGHWAWWGRAGLIWRMRYLEHEYQLFVTLGSCPNLCSELLVHGLC